MKQNTKQDMNQGEELSENMKQDIYLPHIRQSFYK